MDYTYNQDMDTLHSVRNQLCIQVQYTNRKEWYDIPINTDLTTNHQWFIQHGKLHFNGDAINSNVFYINYDNNGELIDKGLMDIGDYFVGDIIQVSIQKADSVDFVGLNYDMYEFDDDSDSDDSDDDGDNDNDNQ